MNKIINFLKFLNNYWKQHQKVKYSNIRFYNWSHVKIFYTGENIHRNEAGFYFKKYEDYGLHSGIDLGLGFDHQIADNYLRFPNWIFYFIKPYYKKEEIKQWCNFLSFPLDDLKKKTQFCALISSHDPNGLRQEIYNALSGIDKIRCGGKLLNNTDELKVRYANDKLGYLQTRLLPSAAEYISHILDEFENKLKQLLA
ncbi:hypothetical protein FACS189413_08860 [Bacteroidia bacterium]|nr:hypothetical protein FACS189413_08860 [Bacteroidia bacterium]